MSDTNSLHFPEQITTPPPSIDEAGGKQLAKILVSSWLDRGSQQSGWLVRAALVVTGFHQHNHGLGGEHRNADMQTEKKTHRFFFRPLRAKKIDLAC